MRQETKVRKGGRTIISEDKSTDRKPAVIVKPEETKEGEKNVIKP